MEKNKMGSRPQMKAIVCPKYGSADVLKYQDVPKPTPDDYEILIRVQASSINSADLHVMKADPFLVRLAFGMFKPAHPILGADVAGVVEMVGSRVTQFKPGDEVFGDLSGRNWGGFAEYASARADSVAIKPVNLTFQQAAAIPLAGVTALQGLRDVGKIKPGQKVLVYGAGGGVGTFLIQLAKFFGTIVTAACHPSKLEKLKELDIDFVLDYTKDDFTRNGQLKYDIICDVGGKKSLREFTSSLSENGTYILFGDSISKVLKLQTFGSSSLLFGNKESQALKSFLATPKKEDLTYLKQLCENEKIKPIIDRVFALNEVPQAIQYLESGKALGKIVISIGT